MGLGLCLTAERPRRGVLRRPVAPEVIVAEVATACVEAVEDPLLREFCATWSSEGITYFRLYPAEEAVELFVGQDGSLVCSAKTSSAGPGYHAYLVDVLQAAGERCGVRWRNLDDEGEPGDDTGYTDHRDMRLLQREMLSWLQALARGPVLTEADGGSISLPVDLRVLGDHFAISALGEWSRAWFEALAGADPDTLEGYGKGFFPWWDRELDARFWLNYGQVMAWVELPWHVPRDDEERRSYELTLRCFERARSLDPGVELPEAEMAEMRRLMDSEVCLAPTPEGMGFRRRMMRLPLTGGWTIDLPGYYHHELEDEGATVVYRFGDRTIQASSYFWGEGVEDPVSPEMLMDLLSGDGETIALDTPPLQGYGRLYAPGEPDEEGWQLSAQVARPRRVCIVTICFGPESDKEWAVEAWRSIRPPGVED